jgi:two-component system LytT family response regulator
MTARLLRCLLVDDEAPARIELRRLLSVHPDVAVVGEAAGVDEALALTGQCVPEVVFLDVHLAGESGFDYVGRVPEPGPHLVFVTAYDRYALRGFECNALDYLLKPVHPERLAETLQRVRSREPFRPPPATGDDAVFLKIGASARLVPWREIHTITASGNYTRLRLADGGELAVLRTLKDWLGIAPPRLFLQVHRSALVQCAAIREVRTVGEKRVEIEMRDGALVAVGREYLAAVRELVRGGRL